MIFSYHWLKELSGTKKSPEKLADLLMAHSFEVESVSAFEHGLSQVVIAKVLAVAKHPNADRLRVAEVSIGKKEKRSIVCGAPNLAVGQKVVVALPGAKLPGGVVIKEAELRGVKSQGMICSAKELGMGTDHTGIFVLPEDAPLGKEFATYAGLEDTVLEVKILPDRSCDALSYQGLAREIAALEGMEPAFLQIKKKTVKPRTSPKVPRITLKTDRCRRYIGLLVEGVQFGPSELHIQSRLIVSGLRPINRIVDLTNYLMLETGQPIHAFDADAIPKGGIVVREAKARERLLLLDGKTIHLSSDDVVIADTKKPLALAGVMGGKQSGVNEKTKRILFEIAHFEPASIRRTEKRHHLLTDAAYRFERGLDLERSGEVALLLTGMIEKWGIGKTTLMRDVGQVKRKNTTIVLELESVEKLLGIKIPLFEVVQYFSWLGLLVKKLPNRAALSVTVPARRPDLLHPEDLIEEIGRLRGYHFIEPLAPAIALKPVHHDEGKMFERQMKELLSAKGFNEVMTYSFYSEKNAELTGIPTEEHLRVANPMNPDQALMRASLFPNLERAALLNKKYFHSFQFFEYGSVFSKGKHAPEEEKRIGLVMVLPAKKDPKENFLTFKGMLAALLESIGVTAEWKDQVKSIPSFYHPARVAHIFSGDTELGFAGEVHPGESRRLGTGTNFFYAEFSVSALMQTKRGSDLVYNDFSRYPLAHRDISLIGPKSVSFAALRMVLEEVGAPLLVSYELFDVYESGEEKSYALHLAFGSPDRTLGGDEMDQAFERIVKVAGERLGMQLKM